MISSLIDTFIGIFSSILQFAFKLSIPFFAFIIYLIIFTFIRFIYFRFVKKDRKIKFIGYIKKESIIKRLFIDLPLRFSRDKYYRDPNEFSQYGLHMFVGEQGSGKTISVVHKLMQLQKQFPKVQVRTNMAYKYQNASVTTWKELIELNNDTNGMIEVLDEIQTWFSSKDSGNLPPSMLTTISQKRKQNKMLIGTAQLYNRIAKEIREQVSWVYCPITLLGCLTIVRVTKPKFWNEEKQKFDRYIKYYFFVQNEKLRNAYDTKQLINSISKVGFGEREKYVLVQS